jgi:heterodisulfide reductase subunit C
MEIPTNQLIEELRRESVKAGLLKEEHKNIADKIKKNGSPF